jgi:ABC-type nitrate/sulfonate/bicarbonate transport system ATPase subunit
MQAVQAIRSLLRQPKPILMAENPFSAPDRATLSLLRERAEQIDAARRYWACPF